MTTNIESLPLLQANIGVGSDEDLVIALGFTMADGVTPLSLAGISFTAAATSLLTGTTIATLSSLGGEVVISGASSNFLTITELAAAKAAWGVGAYALTLTASDGTYTKDVFVSSSVIVGAPSPLSVTVVRAGGAAAVSAASAAQLVAPAAVQAAVVAYLAGLPTTEPGAPGVLWLNGGVLQVS
jgi:hypothetical protein